MGHFLFYDEKFRRQPVDGQIESHALWVANPPNGRLLPGPPQHWPDMGEWEIGFGDQDDDELYMALPLTRRVAPLRARRIAGCRRGGSTRPRHRCRCATLRRTPPDPSRSGSP